jgi:predicted HicB family RNase H-like nuclease
MKEKRGGARPGAGAPKKEPSTTISIRVKESVLAAWRKAAERDEKNVNRWILDKCNGVDKL